MSSPWWRGAVLYHVYPLSFCDGDGDGLGDLPGLASRLDYVAGLGVDGVWLSPVFPSPLKDFGYDVSDYCAIDPRMGDLRGFDDLVQACHRRGLKLIIDQVWSHSSDAHPWFQDSRRRLNSRDDFYVWADPRPDGGPPNNWLGAFGGPAWTWDGRRRAYYLHNFLPSQPDLNFRNPAVQAEILKVARFWLDRGVDGFRLDVANYYFHDAALTDNPPSGIVNVAKPFLMQRHLHQRSQPETLAFLERVRDLLDGYGDRLAVGELFTDRPMERMAQYAGPGRLHGAYSFLFLGPRPTAAEFGEALEAYGTMAAEAWPFWSFGNHDVARLATRWGADRPARFVRTLIALLTSLRGSSFLYQGDELGLTEARVPFDRLRDPDGLAHWPDHPGRDGCRTPMPWRSNAPHLGFGTAEPWLPAEPAHARLAVDLQEADPDSTLNFTRAWLRFRRKDPALTGERQLLFAPQGDVFGMMRGTGSDRRLFLVNFGSETEVWRLSQRGWRDAFPLGGRIEGPMVRLAPGAGFLGAPDGVETA